ncbi:hypothetical protein KVR01_011972 [Diaporthe batatas]|uniref:uncharacterized protein n=1 Tax=Diaporthe batatas TaxID=748121 RepID=UPI001D0459EA|nr:uncharacterized protein KVR01_011972 [Diaporthe batatas]KAG8158211.1 hypothetical protein KVR01_011972 [Diaporthe batatas]
MQCNPHNAIWDFYLQTPDNCYSLPKVMLASASVQVVSDWTMVLLPQKVIWSLNMNWQRKVGISVLFTVGLLASVSASVRLYTTINFAGTEDQMYFIAPLLFWACAEMTCGFVILSVPCIPKFMSESGISPRLKQLLQRVPGRSGKSTAASNPQSYKFGDIVTIGGSNGNKKVARDNTYFEIADGGVELGAVETNCSRDDDKARHK